MAGETGFNWGGLAGGLIGGLGSMIGAGINSATQSKINKENIEMQKEFAQNGIQWKVQDAQKAGIHPAVALGSQTYQASPSSVAPNVGGGVSDAFKHFGSAIDSFIDDKAEERNLQLENMKLQNEKEKLEIAKMRNATSNSINPNSFVSSNGLDGVPNNDKLLFGQKKVTDDFNLTRTSDGNIVITPSDDVSEYVSESYLGSAGWHWRNYSPSLDDNLYSSIHNRLVQSKQLNPFSEGLIHSWSPLSGNNWKVVSKKSDEWKDYLKYGSKTPLGVAKSIYKSIDTKDISGKDEARKERNKSFYKRYGNPFKGLF